VEKKNSIYSAILLETKINTNSYLGPDKISFIYNSLGVVGDLDNVSRFKYQFVLPLKRLNKICNKMGDLVEMEAH
jgi:hypothetical protein